MIFVKNFILPDFTLKFYTAEVRYLQHCSRTIYRAEMMNAFNISNLDIFVRIELNHAAFEKKQAQNLVLIDVLDVHSLSVQLQRKKLKFSQGTTSLRLK